MKKKAMVLIGTFQGAILELSAKLDAEKDLMSPVDVENTNYVAGMASVNAFNLEQVVKQGATYYEANKAKVDRLFAEATGFAEALRAEGYGLALVGV
jgi:hypothetical protein